MIYHVRIQPQLFGLLGSGLWLMRYDHARKQTWVAKPVALEWELREEAFRLGDPTLAVEPELVQAIAHAMVESKDLPAGFLGNDAQMKATLRHLEDMRSLVFDRSKP